MSNVISTVTPSVTHTSGGAAFGTPASVLMGGYACAGFPFVDSVEIGRERMAAKQHPGTLVWSPPT